MTGPEQGNKLWSRVRFDGLLLVQHLWKYVILIQQIFDLIMRAERFMYWLVSLTYRQARRCHRPYSSNIFSETTESIKAKLCPPPPQPKGMGGGCIAFGADPVGVRIASCLHSFFWSNRWILTKLAYTHYWDGGKNWLDFGDLDLIFKVTPVIFMSNFDQNTLSALYHLNQITDSGQSLYTVGLR